MPLLTLKGCTKGKHTDEVPKATAPKAKETEAPTASSGGVETYGSAPPSVPTTGASTPAPAPATIATQKPAAPEPVVEVEDDLSLPVPDGARCKRLGCGAVWEGEAVSRGDGEKAVCTYHPQKVSACSSRATAANGMPG